MQKVHQRQRQLLLVLSGHPGGGAEENQELPENVINDICASFQECVSKTLVKKLKKAVEERGYNQVVIAGGVAANSEIRKKVFDLEKEGYHVHAPAMKYCTDNASMVAVF